MKEIWKDIRGYKNLYQISNKGRVKSLARFVTYKWRNRAGVVVDKTTFWKKRILAPAKAGKIGNFYLAVSLCKDGILNQAKIHVLVAIHFKRNPKKLKHVNHKRNPFNNNIRNLEWCSVRENTTHGVLRKKRTSKFIGVTWRKREKKWYAQITISGKKKHLGQFDSELKAHKAYLRALRKYNLLNKYA